MAMYFYTVPKVGDGTELNPFRPDLPEGTPFVGNVGSDEEYLIALPIELVETTKMKRQLPRQALENACKAKGILYDDTQKWFVGGG
jgi:hypothetical protein